MKTSFLILFLIFLNPPSISEIRKLFVTVNSSASNAKVFASKLDEVNKDDDKVLVAYKGVSLAMLSKLEKKVSDKSKKFKEASCLIEYAVANEPNSIEIRMIRLSIQENVPKIVNYRKNIKEDKAFLLDNYKKQTEALRTYIGGFIEHSKSFTATEKQSVK